jgi:hypothetical protein
MINTMKTASNSNKDSQMSAGASNTKMMDRSEIGTKWSKFTADELSALKSKDDVIAQVISKYGLEKAQAQRDVDALMRGRHF